MHKEVFEVMQERFHLLDSTKYFLRGKWPKEYEVDAWLDDLKIDGTIEDCESVSALERFDDLDRQGGKRVTVTLELPKDLENYRRLTVYAVRGKDRIRWFKTSAAGLAKRQGVPQFYIEEENVQTQEKSCRLRGWVTADKPVEVGIYDEVGKRIDCEILMTNRSDVVNCFSEAEIDPKCGFSVDLKNVTSKVLYLVFRTADSKVSYPVDQRKVFILKKKAKRYVQKGNRYLRVHGMAAFAEKVFQKMNRAKYAPISYSKWLPKHLPGEKELKQQRETKFAYNPKFSIVVPLYRTPTAYLEKMVDSVRGQTYGNWELCLSDGSGNASPILSLIHI